MLTIRLETHTSNLENARPSNSLHLSPKPPKPPKPRNQTTTQHPPATPLQAYTNPPPRNHPRSAPAPPNSQRHHPPSRTHRDNTFRRQKRSLLSRRERRMRPLWEQRITMITILLRLLPLSVKMGRLRIPRLRLNED